MATDVRQSWGLLFDQLGVAALTLDEYGSVSAVNPAAEQLLGWSAAELSGRAFADLVAPERRAHLQAPNGGGVDLPDVILASKAGASVRCSLVLLPMRTPEGRGPGRLAVVREPLRDAAGALRESELTDRRLANEFLEHRVAERTEALQKQTAILQSQTEASPDGVLVMGPDRRFVSCNRRFREMWGLTEELVAPGAGADAAIRHVLPMLVDPDGFVARIRQNLEHQEEYAHDEIRLKDGRVFDRYSAPIRGSDGTHHGRVSFYRDVTESRRSAEQLRFQKSLLECQTETGIDGILVVSPEGRMISLNRRFIEMWGIPAHVVESRSDDAAIASVLDKLVDPAGFIARVRHLYDHRDEESRDEIALKDGRTFDRYSAPIRSADGTHYGRVWYFRDVSPQRRNEEELRQSRERVLRQQAALLAVTRSPEFQSGDFATALGFLAEADARTLGVERVGLWLYAGDRKTLRCAELYELGTGRHSSGMELETSQFPAYFRAIERSDALAADDAQRDPRTIEFVESYLKPLGITSMMDAPVHLQGGIAGVLCHEHVGPPRRWTPDEQSLAAAMANLASLVLSRLEHRRLELRLAAQYAVTRVLSEAASLDEAAPRILKAIGENLGWEAGGLWTFEGPARALSCAHMWHPGTAAHREFARASRRASCPPGSGLIGRVASDRAPAWVPDIAARPDFGRAAAAARAGLRSAVVFPIVRGEDVLGVIELFGRDVRLVDDEQLRVLSSIGSQAGQFVERTRAEAEIRRAVEETRRAYRTLQRAQRRVIRAEKMASVGMVMAGIAHEINNPLNVMYGNLRLLRSGGVSRSGAAQMLADALTAAENARRVVEEFRHFARDRGEAERVDLRRCIGEAVELAKPLAGRRVRLRAELGRALPARIFPNQIRRAVANLLKNAVEAIPGRGTVTVSLRRRNGDALIAVTDTGPGIDRRVRERMFEPFVTTKEAGKGFGLGLALCQALVQNHRGEISVRVRAGQGARFVIRLPIGE